MIVQATQREKRALGRISTGLYLITSQKADLSSAMIASWVTQASLNFIDKTGFPFYYTFTQNGIFYLVWDASTHLISGQQLNWAAKNLSSTDAKNAKMRLVIGHLPLYGIAVGRNRPGDYLADASLVILAEELGNGRILSIDNRDFNTYRWKNKKIFLKAPII